MADEPSGYEPPEPDELAALKLRRQAAAVRRIRQLLAGEVGAGVLDHSGESGFRATPEAPRPAVGARPVEDGQRLVIDRNGGVVVEPEYDVEVPEQGLTFRDGQSHCSAFRSVENLGDSSVGEPGSSSDGAK
jgi:hypothetical protein